MTAHKAKDEKVIKLNNKEVVWNHGFAHFTQYGIFVPCSEEAFNYEWVLRVGFRLAPLNGKIN